MALSLSYKMNLREENIFPDAPPFHFSGIFVSLIKIILSVADERINQELINAKVEGVNLRQRAQDKPPIGGSLKEDTLDR